MPIFDISASEEGELNGEPDLSQTPLIDNTLKQPTLSSPPTETEQFMHLDDKTNIGQSSQPVSSLTQWSNPSIHQSQPPSAHSSWVWDREGNPKHQHKLSSKSNNLLLLNDFFLFLHILILPVFELFFFSKISLTTFYYIINNS